MNAADASMFIKKIKKENDRATMLELMYKPSKVVPIKILKDILTESPHYIDVIAAQEKVIGVVNLLTIMTTNATYDEIPDVIFEKLFIDVILTDRFYKFMEDEEFELYPYTTVMMRRLLRYNLTYKKNIYNYAKKVVSKRMMADKHLNFDTQVKLEMKLLLDKVYERERIMKYKTKSYLALKLDPYHHPSDRVEKVVFGYLTEAFDRNIRPHLDYMQLAQNKSVDLLTRELKPQADVWCDGLLRLDMFVPGLDLILELNGQNHFYPYTKKVD